MKSFFELAEEEKQKTERRINQVLAGGCPRGINKLERCLIAEQLYKARWHGNTYHEADEMTHEALLEKFCWSIFGASLGEVLKAWDRYLG